MGPKKNKKKDDDEMWNQNQKNLQEILKKVGHPNSKKYQKIEFSEESQKDINTKSKQVFDWQLSKKSMKALQKAEQKKEQKMKQKQQQQQQAKKLTFEQQKQLQRKLQKQKQEKQKKQKKKEEKKAERQKQLEQQKIEQQRIKEEEQKNLQQVEKRLKKKSSNGKYLPIFFAVFIIFLCVLQYQREIYVRLSKFKLESEENYYDIFEIDSGVTDRELKEKYKRLVLKYHPDKNPGCVQCQGKFNKIIKAWEVLGSPEKRKHYDSNSGFVTQIKSHSVTLTPMNYEDFIENSKSLWLIQVYDSTEKYCHYFAQFWEEMVQQYGGVVKFGRVDVWTQTNMLSYLPYKFQVFPSIYYYHKGEIGLCPFDFQKPDWSVRRCLESQYKQNLVKQIHDLSEIQKSSKVSLIFTDKVKIGSKFKILNKKYESEFNFYSLKNNNKNHEIMAVLPNNKTYSFALDQKSIEFYEKYEKFLESLIIQKVSICELIATCENEPCYLLLDEEISNQEVNKINLPQQDPLSSKPVFFVQENEFYHALEDLKNRTEMRQKFTLGLYQNGHIDLGYIEEALILNPQHGQSFQNLHCIYKDRSWFGFIKSTYNKLIDKF